MSKLIQPEELLEEIVAYVREMVGHEEQREAERVIREKWRAHVVEEADADE